MSLNGAYERLWAMEIEHMERNCQRQEALLQHMSQHSKDLLQQRSKCNQLRSELEKFIIQHEREKLQRQQHHQIPQQIPQQIPHSQQGLANEGASFSQQHQQRQPEFPASQQQQTELEEIHSEIGIRLGSHHQNPSAALAFMAQQQQQQRHMLTQQLNLLPVHPPQPEAMGSFFPSTSNNLQFVSQNILPQPLSANNNQGQTFAASTVQQQPTIPPVPQATLSTNQQLAGLFPPGDPVHDLYNTIPSTMQRTLLAKWKHDVEAAALGQVDQEAELEDKSVGSMEESSCSDSDDDDDSDTSASVVVADAAVSNKPVVVGGGGDQGTDESVAADEVETSKKGKRKRFES